MCKFKKVVIIDDESSSLFISRRIIEKANVFKNIQTFESPKTALNYLNKIYSEEDINEIPDLILVDINMPVMDGWEFVRQFEQIPNELTQNTTINILSSSISQVDLQTAQSLKKVNKFLSKPLTIELIKSL